jgi:DNA topoisomerase-1
MEPIAGATEGSTDATAPATDLGNCPECNSPLVQKFGRFGAFISCSNYPTCKYIQKKQGISTGVPCPKCGKGDIVGRRSKRGKIFYGCNKYPDCDFALWDKPTGDKCPTCQSLMVLKGKDETLLCSNPACPDKKKNPETTPSKPRGSRAKK